jgi:alkylhydroperoxidase family enzyme
MRLQPLPPDRLTDEQRLLRDDMAVVIERDFGGLIARLADGALIGPFNAWLHWPEWGSAAWALNRSLWEHTVLPPDIHQLVILVTAARFGARYELYGHEYFGRRCGMSEVRIATVAAGQRPADLTPVQAAAYDMAAALNRGGSVPESTYRVAASALGTTGVAEIVFLVGCFSLVAVTLNAFDEPVPGQDFS